MRFRKISSVIKFDLFWTNSFPTLSIKISQKLNKTEKLTVHVIYFEALIGYGLKLFKTLAPLVEKYGTTS